MLKMTLRITSMILLSSYPLPHSTSPVEVGARKCRKWSSTWTACDGISVDDRTRLHCSKGPKKNKAEHCHEVCILGTETELVGSCDTTYDTQLMLSGQITHFPGSVTRVKLWDASVTGTLIGGHNIPANNADSCPEAMRQQQNGETVPCSDVCVGQWGPWSACVSSSTGMTSRTWQLDYANSEGPSVCAFALASGGGPPTQTAQCAQVCIPHATDREWGVCDKVVVNKNKHSAGVPAISGTVTTRRIWDAAVTGTLTTATLTNPGRVPMNNANSCPDSAKETETLDCNTVCVGDWTEWSACSDHSAGSTSYRTWILDASRSLNPAACTFPSPSQIESCSEICAIQQDLWSDTCQLSISNSGIYSVSGTTTRNVVTYVSDPLWQVDHDTVCPTRQADTLDCNSGCTWDLQEWSSWTYLDATFPVSTGKRHGQGGWESQEIICRWESEASFTGTLPKDICETTQTRQTRSTIRKEVKCRYDFRNEDGYGDGYDLAGAERDHTWEAFVGHAFGRVFLGSTGGTFHMHGRPDGTLYEEDVDKPNLWHTGSRYRGPTWDEFVQSKSPDRDVPADMWAKRVPRTYPSLIPISAMVNEYVSTGQIPPLEMQEEFCILARQGLSANPANEEVSSDEKSTAEADGTIHEFNAKVGRNVLDCQGDAPWVL